MNGPALAIALAAVALLSGLPRAQEEVKKDKGGKEPHYIRLRWPADKGRAVAEMGGTTVTLEALVKHMEERHYPGFGAFLADPGGGDHFFTSPFMPTWVRQYADILALQAEARERGLDLEDAEPLLSDALKRAFQEYLDGYVEKLERSGSPTNLDNDRVNRLLAEYQMKHGLAAELQGWLDFLERDDYTDAELREFFQDHARVFGGMVTFAHILIQHRDAATGILLKEEGRRRAMARLEDVRAQLADDGSNFEEVARLRSEDSRTAPRGGVLENVQRFDPLLPAALCRTVWYLRDGEMCEEPVETQYGFHFVKRISFAQRAFALFTPAFVPKVREAMRRERQEKLLLEQRDELRVRLLY